MDYESFKEEVKNACIERLGEDFEVYVHKVAKNNSTYLDALLISKRESNVSPTVYLEGYWNDYNNGRTLEDIADGICNAIWSDNTPDFSDVENFCDFEKVKGRIVYKLINYEKNEGLIEDLPHVKVLDLAVVFLYLVKNEHLTNASILIHNAHAKTWGVDEKTLYELAVKNTPQLLPSDMKNILYYIKKMFERNPGLPFEMDMFDEDRETPMYVLSNSLGMYGAGAVLYENELKKISERLDADLIILPSSVHEGATRFAV